MNWLGYLLCVARDKEMDRSLEDSVLIRRRKGKKTTTKNTII